MKMGVMGNPNMPYPQRRRSIKDLLSNNNDANSIIKYGFPVQLGTQLVTLRMHGANPPQAPTFTLDPQSIGAPCSTVELVIKPMPLHQ